MYLIIDCSISRVIVIFDVVKLKKEFGFNHTLRTLLPNNQLKIKGCRNLRFAAASLNGLELINWDRCGFMELTAP